MAARRRGGRPAQRRHRGVDRRAGTAPSTSRCSPTTSPQYFDALLPLWNTRSAAIRERLIGKEYPLAFYPLGLADPELVATTEAWLAANEDAPQALRRLVLEKRDAARTRRGGPAVRREACLSG